MARLALTMAAFAVAALAVAAPGATASSDLGGGLSCVVGLGQSCYLCVGPGPNDPLPPPYVEFDFSGQLNC